MECKFRKAVFDSSLEAKIVRRIPLVYAEGPSEADDRPPFVLAASGLASLGELLFVVQDNANWLAVVQPDDRVTAVPLPRGPEGARVFSKERQNDQDKVDLEACVVVRGAEGPELVAFGSGTGDSSCWILNVTRPEHAASAEDPSQEADGTAFLDAGPFYESLRENRAFTGGKLNIEGAIALDSDRILILQRGNPPRGEGEPVDATAELSWSALKPHLEDPASVPPPQIENVIRYELGELDGVRLTFSDAEYLGEGRILYSASAEDSGSGDIAGSVLGLIEPSGETRWAEIITEDGGPFKSKIEGLSLAPGERARIRFVIDDDDETAPSEIYEAELGDAFKLS